MLPPPRIEKRFLIVLVVSAILQISIAALPDTMGDIRFYRLWTNKIVDHGITAAYWDYSKIQSTGPDFYYPIDYPPVLPFFLFTLGKIVKSIAPVAFESNGCLLDFLIKLLLIAANLLMASLIFFELRRTGKPEVALLGAGFFALNPGVIFDVAYWGQADSMTALSILLALIMVARGKPELAWISITVGAFTKPLVLPFIPIVALATWKHHSWKRVLASAGFAALTTVLIFLPFCILGKFSAIVRWLFLQIDAMPHVSVNAHNLWWLSGGGLPWTNADLKFMNLVSYRVIGIVLFVSFYAFSLWKFARSEEKNSIYTVSAATAFGFFILSTHMHENHLFHFFPLVSMICFTDRRLTRIAIILSVTFLANMLLHDPFLTTTMRNFGAGPRFMFPQPGAADLVYDYFTKQGNPYPAALARGDSSLLWIVATMVNSLIQVMAFAYWTFLMYSKRHSRRTGAVA